MFDFVMLRLCSNAFLSSIFDDFDDLYKIAKKAKCRKSEKHNNKEPGVSMTACCLQNCSILMALTWVILHAGSSNKKGIVVFSVNMLLLFRKLGFFIATNCCYCFSLSVSPVKVFCQNNMMIYHVSRMPLSTAFHFSSFLDSEAQEWYIVRNKTVP